jgi:hypothetical protein
MHEYNEKSLLKSIENMNKNKQMHIVLCNMRAINLRLPTNAKPERKAGGGNMFNAIRGLVTKVGKSGFDCKTREVKDINEETTEEQKAQEKEE